MDTLTVNNLGRHLHPKPLFLGIMEVDELREEENNRRSPKHYEIPVRLGNITKNERDVPTAIPYRAVINCSDKL